MNQIENYNCLDLCMEKYCDNHITHYYNIKLNGMQLFLTFCKEHFEIFLENESKEDFEQ